MKPMSVSGRRKEKKRESIALMTEAVRKHIREAPCDLSDEEVGEFIAKLLTETAGSIDVLAPAEKLAIAETVFAKTRHELGVLMPLASDPDVTEIMVNGAGAVFIERKGCLERTDIEFGGVEELEDVIRRVAAGVHREINELSPILDARLEDGSRVNAVYRNIALGGPILTIRRFPASAITMEELVRSGSVTPEAADFLVKLVEAGYNIFISGGTSSGKTTFLNALSNFIPRAERIVTIEDSAELQIKGIENLVRLECKSANVQGKGEVSMRHLIKASLRMRPDRIIVGEVRGEEVMDMIQAMNTGHSGSLSTGHANSPSGMLYRLEAMFLQAAEFPLGAIRRQIAEGIDLIVHLARLTGGVRKVTEIAELRGVIDGEIALNTLYRLDGERRLASVGKLEDTSKLSIAGVRL
ncbi:MAG: CpaF family protein [Clostridiales Family XIII bacterium]|jgi:pilus assembly protein CpaF|nr:CpaF family protein [Clostridiales Family XIII bacterium]